MVIRGADGERVVSMTEFHVGPYVTAVGDGEMLTEVRIPLRAGGGSAHEKVERRAGDWAIAAASAAVWIDGGAFADAGLALSAVGPHDRPPLARRGGPPWPDPLRGAVCPRGADRLRGLRPDRRRPGPVDYKRHLAGVLTKRALRRATARALHQEV